MISRDTPSPQLSPRRPFSAGLVALSLAFSSLAGPIDAVLIDPLCGNVREAMDLGIRPPSQPRQVDLPVGPFCPVSNTLELQLAVLDCDHPDIVLRPGVYDPADLFGDFLAFPEQRRLWAENPGSVTLQFGISLQQHAASELHGLVIDILDPQHAVPIGPPANGYLGAVVYWGTTATNIRIQDTDIYGHGQVHVGILGGHADGTEIRRVGIQEFLRFGVRLNQVWTQPVVNQARISDIVVRRVIDSAWQQLPSYTPGTAEHGIWIGLPTRLERAQVRDAHWSGIITGNCVKIDADDQCDSNPLDNVQMFDIDVDRIGMADGVGVSGPGSGISFERVSTDISVRRFCIGPDTEQGVHAEWNHGFATDSPRDLSILTGVISSHRVGVFLGSGTEDSTLQSLHFRRSTSHPNEHWTAVGMNCSVWPETCSTISLLDLTYDADVCCHEARGTYNVAECCAGPCDVGLCQF